jgi:hypothetical protein
MVNGFRNDPMQVPADDGKMRFWRNTAVAALGTGQTATLPTGSSGPSGTSTWTTEPGPRA